MIDLSTLVLAFAALTLVIVGLLIVVLRRRFVAGGKTTQADTRTVSGERSTATEKE